METHRRQTSPGRELKKTPLCEAGECDTAWFGEYGLRDGMWRVTHGDEFYSLWEGLSCLEP